MLLLAACARAPKPAETVEPPAPAPPPVVEQPESPEAELDRFCGALARIVDAEPQRYISLRDAPEGPDRWAGQAVPPRFTSCAVEGSAYPTASYVCLGETLSSTSGDLLGPSFEQVGRMIDACLDRPSWYPREWRRGQSPAAGRLRRATGGVAGRLGARGTRHRPQDRGRPLRRGLLSAPLGRDPPPDTEPPRHVSARRACSGPLRLAEQGGVKSSDRRIGLAVEPPMASPRRDRPGFVGHDLAGPERQLGPSPRRDRGIRRRRARPASRRRSPPPRARR